MKPRIKKNEPKKCSIQYFLNCSYRLGRLKRQQTSDKLRFLHRSYMRAKQNGGLLLREKQARQPNTCLSKPLTAQRRSHRLIDHRTIEPLNHATIERKISNRSRIWSAAGWCPAAIYYNYYCFIIIIIIIIIIVVVIMIRMMTMLIFFTAVNTFT